MSKRSRAAQASLHAITHGNESPKKLPDVVKIRESQATALAVLLPEKQRLLKELQAIEGRITNVIAEFDGDYGLTAPDMDKYQLAGYELVLLKANPELPPAE